MRRLDVVGSASTHLCGGVGTWVWWDWGACTLLGPEGSAVLVAAFSLLGEAPVGVDAGMRSYFENYTVDASILKKANTDSFVSVAHVISSL